MNSGARIVPADRAGASARELAKLVGIDAVAARHQHDAGRVGVVGLVADVFQPRQLLRPHLVGDLLDDLRRRDLVRQFGDHDVRVFLYEHAACADGAAAGLVHRLQVGGFALGVVDDRLRFALGLGALALIVGKQLLGLPVAGTTIFFQVCPTHLISITRIGVELILDAFMEE